jgi:SRSO17 transposase
MTPPATIFRGLRLSRGRFAIAQFFQRDKADLGLDHYEGRWWQGFHHHLVLAAVAYVFGLVSYLRSKKISGVTWEPVLHAIQPWLVRWIGCCPCCGEHVEPRVFNSP